MGVTRKALSLTTYGLIDWKSDKERIAASTRKTKSATRKTTKLLMQQNKLMKEQRHK